jgi:hypothetical protein
MLVRRLSRLLATAVLALAFVALTGVAGGSEANAQGRYYDDYRNRQGYYDDYRYRQELRQREALRRYHLRQRFLYGNSRGWGRYQRFDRSPYYNGYRGYRGYRDYPFYRRW